MAERVWDKIEEDVRHIRSDEAKAHGGHLPPASDPAGSASMLQSEVERAAHAPTKASALHNLKKSAQLYNAIESSESPDGNVQAGSDASKLKGLIQRNKFHGKAPHKDHGGVEGEREFMADQTVVIEEGKGQFVTEKEPAV
ncbi:hypothetical protein BJ508DRAFT_332444 [Ascobolus immersus RN42]|uniref:Uncharacterized protein n=1 Tax=Ascobolus immersus RN42 TaxID=1160509 RepID=A0A3N4HMN0_ASCIM|nr:hypothetical protein BJ508DRAFT_332444 [Ascobolus immersus RN42]